MVLYFFSVLQVLCDHGMLLLSLALLIYVSFAAFRLVSDPLRKIPGPFWARYTRLWEFFTFQKGNWEKVNVDLHETYGSIVRLGPNRYSIDDPASIGKIYGYGSKFDKTAYYYAWNNPNPHQTNPFTELKPDEHARQRKKISALYSMSSLLYYEAFVDNCNTTLAAKLRNFASTGESFDVPTWMQFYAYDVIGEITIGHSFGIMDQGRDSGILRALDRFNRYGSSIGLLPGVHGLLWNLEWLSGGILKLAPIHKVQEEVTRLIRTKQAGAARPSDRNDFMNKGIQLLKEGRIEPNDLNNIIGSNIGAGSDTTAISLSSVIYYLAKHPNCAKKLREEIDKFAIEDRMSDPVTFKEAQEMPYLQAVIKEALRVNPAVGQPLARVVPPEGMELAGKWFPGGTEVGTNAWVLHRNTAIFGPDAHVFRPERWLESKEKSAEMEQFNFAFGAGSRTCMGKRISLLEMTKVIPQLYRQFDFELVGQRTQRNIWFVKPSFKCLVKLRKGALA